MITDHLELASELKKKGEPFAIATVVRAEKPTSAKPGAVGIITLDRKLTGWVGGSCAEPTVKKEALKSIADGQPRLLRLCPPERLGQGSQDGVVEVALTCISGGTYEIYIEPQMVKPHLVIVGHLATAEALARLGKNMGYPFTVMGYETEGKRFAGAEQVIERIDFSRIDITPHTFVIVASHGNYDEEALEKALRSPAPFVTLIASPRRSEAILQYLKDSDLMEGWEKRFKYPAGLDIGAVTADEIALSILAEIVQVRRKQTMEAIQMTDHNHEDHDHDHHHHHEHESSGTAIDPVCKMTVDIETAKYKTEYKGETYYFCAPGCQYSFENDPERYLFGASS